MDPQKNNTGRSRGRPAIGKGRKLGLRIRPELDDAIDRWMAEQNDPRLTKPEAIRQLLWKGLAAKS
jgi:hypothetical protein